MKSFKPFGPSLGKGKLSKNIINVINNEIDKTIINKNDMLIVRYQLLILA